MDFRILGPLEVTNAAGVVALGGIRPRALLTVLLLHPNESVSAERLALALWGEDAPAGASKTVRVYVSRLRKALGDPDAVTTTPAGYRLRVRPDELDADRFQRGVAEARLALAADEPDRAAVMLDEALALWRGPPLAELQFEPFAQAEIARLEEQRLAALEARTEAHLAAGRHAEVVSELRRLLSANPTREGLAAQLMVALYRSGRQAEALDVYRGTRHVLVEESGIEPGPELRRLQEAVLAQDPALELEAPATELPGELDAATEPPLVGRDVELARLRAHWDAARTGTTRLVAVIGPAGMGKTRLAAELAGEVHRDGGVVAYVSGRSGAAGGTAALSRIRGATRAALLVVDDADRGGTEAAAALAVRADEHTRPPLLVVVCGCDADALERLGAADVVALGPLDAGAARALAGRDDLPLEVLSDAAGVPGCILELVGRWARREAARRVDAMAERTAAGRDELGSREAALARGVLELQAAGERVEVADAGDAPVRCPFKGLAAFDVADAPYFFGRERLVAELVAKLVGAPLLGVVGPSGSGKSSVVRAGLLPALAAGVLPLSDTWVRAVMRPGEHPLGELAAAMATITADEDSVLVVDQFEEAFTVCRDRRERDGFIAELAAVRAQRTVVLAIRADHYGRCAAYPELSALLAAHHVLVGAMRRDELRRAVERPAQLAGLRVDPDLTDVLIADVEHEPGALPMLSTALLELWQRREGRRLRFATYEATGGVRGAVARHAEDAFAQLDVAQQQPARDVLLRLVTDDGAGGVERRRVPLGELDEDVAQIAHVLADQRLLTISAGAVELAHEALLREWPRLRGWLEEDADGRRLRRHLTTAASEWQASGRDDADLYRGARLATALEWQARHEPGLNRVERDFLDASRDAEERRIHAARARRVRALTAGLAALAIVTVVSTVVAVRGVQRAHFEQRAAASRTLAAQAVTHLRGNVALAGLLGLEAYRREPTVEARNAILGALPAVAGAGELGPPLERDQPVQAAAFSSDGTMLASGRNDGSVSLWDVRSRRRLGRWQAHATAIVNDVAFSPDGRLLATAGEDHTTRLWNVATRRPVGMPLRSRGKPLHVAFSPDGTTLAAIANDASVSIWNVRTHARVIRRPLIGAVNRDSGDALPASDVAFDRDGALVAASIARDGVRLWRTGARGLVGRPLEGPSGSATYVALSPDGETLLTGASSSSRLWNVRTRRPLAAPFAGAFDGRPVVFSSDATTLAAVVGIGGGPQLLHLWSARDGRPIGTPLASHGGDHLAAVALSRDGVFAAGDEDGTLRLWNVRPRAPLGHALGNHGGWVRGLAFTAGGGTLASAGVDGTARRWDVRARRRIGRALAQPGDVLAVASSPDGRTLATAGASGVRLWDQASGRPLARMAAGVGVVRTVAFAPDGRTLASAGDDGTIRVWDARTGRSLGAPLNAEAGAVNTVAFDHDGDLLAAAGQDGAVRLWDVEDRRPDGRPLRVTTGFVNTVAFSPDDKVLASAGRGGLVWLWDLGDRRPLGPPLRGHTDVVSSVAFSADGATLASAGADKTVRLWDVRAHRELGRPLEPHDGWLSAVAFDPRDGRLAEAGEDGVIRLWDPVLWSDDLDALTRHVCGVVRRSLTRAEWAEFLPGRPYHPTCPEPAAR